MQMENIGNMKCTLEHDVNKCPFFIPEPGECKNENACSFQEKENVIKPNTYVRKERWYEEYYKKRKN